MAIFLIFATGLVQVTSQGAASYRLIKLLQKNLEAAQFAMSVMAKELRTSSIVGSDATTITFVDYSQKKCIRYSFTGDELWRGDYGVGSDDPNANRATCLGAAPAVSQLLVKGITAYAMNIDSSTPMPNPHVGRATVSITVGSSGQRATLQTTVSLRDYHYIIPVP